MSSNNKAIVATVDAVIEIPGADRIHVCVVMGENCITSKDVGVGTVGILFPVGLQLSEEYVHENNLSRDSTKNKNPEKTGFFEANRRIRAQPFKGVTSTAYFASMESVEYTGAGELNVGDAFTELKGHKICEKYISEKTKKAMGNNATKAAKADYAPDFAKHYDSDHLKRGAHTIPTGALLSLHSKSHGTSGRSSKVMTTVDLPKWKILVNRACKYAGLNPLFPEMVMNHVVGTRNVVLKDPGKMGFHGTEAFRFEVASVIEPFLQDNMIAYYEIMGFVNGKPIMSTHNAEKTKNKEFVKKYGKTITYKYGCLEHQYKFFIYRLARVIDGEVVDFSQKQLEQWCDERGLPRTLDLVPQWIHDGDGDALIEYVESLVSKNLYEDPRDPSHPTEGAILRVDSGNDKPKFFKYKTDLFYAMESASEEVDLEDAS